MRIRRWMMTALAAALAVPLLSCTGTDVLLTSNSSVEVTLTASNLANTRFDDFQMQLLQVFVRPADPAADAALGAEAYGAISPGTLQSYGSQATLVGGARLRKGDYRVTAIRLGSLTFIDNDPAPNPPADCYDNFTEFPGIYPILSSVTLSNVSAPVIRITDQAGQINIVLDTEQLFEAYKAATFCRDTPGTLCRGAGTVRFPAPCLERNFDSTAFAALSGTYLSFN